jgi:hypothetical protein
MVSGWLVVTVEGVVTTSLFNICTNYKNK